MMVAFHLEVLYQGFLFKEYKENYLENIDEMHFMITMDNSKTLGFCREQVIKYVVFGREAMTLVVWLTGGIRAKIKAPMVIFTNSNRTYLICGV